MAELTCVTMSLHLYMKRVCFQSETILDHKARRKPKYFATFTLILSTLLIISYGARPVVSFIRQGEVSGSATPNNGLIHHENKIGDVLKVRTQKRKTIRDERQCF